MLKNIVNLIQGKNSSRKSAADIEIQPEALGDLTKVEQDNRHRKFEQSRADANKNKAEEETVTVKEDKVKRISDDIRSALKQKKIKFLYQPIFDATENYPVFYDVCSNILDETGVMVKPEDFLPVANKYGLTDWLDKVIVSCLLEQHKDGMDSFAISITGGTLKKSEEFFEALMVVGMETGFSPDRLIINLDFHDIENNTSALGLIKEATAMQYRFMLGYIGGGAKVIQMIQKLGFSYIKINSLIFSNFATNTKVADDLKNIANTAKELNINIIMDKVETKEMYEFCKEIGLIYVQGDYLSEMSDKLEV